jgi:hypothetical protein
VRTPLSARIGIYLILAGLAFDLILHYAGGVEYFIPGIGAFSTLLLPLGLILLVGTAIFQLIALRRERAERISLTSPGPQSGELQVGHGPALSLLEQRVDIGRPLRRSAWVGVVLVLFGIALFIGIQRWMATRTFTAVDMPVSLAPGRIRTGAFHINLEGEYEIWLRASDSGLIDPKCVALTPFDAHWDLYHDGKAVSSSLQGYVPSYIGEFYSYQGTYDLDLQILSDSSCLNSGHPRLRIYTSKSDHEGDTTPALWLGVLSIAVGTSLLVFFVLGHESRSPALTNITDSETIEMHFQWAQKLPLKPGLSGLPSFGLVCSLVLSWMVMFHMVFYQGGRFRSIGITVFVMQQASQAEDRDRWAEPLVLRVQSAGPGLAPPNLFLNSRSLSWDELNSGLKAELGQRSVWTWQDAVQAIDAARGLGAKVVLLTSTESKQH